MSIFAEQMERLWELRALDARLHEVREREARAARGAASAAAAVQAAERRRDEARNTLRTLEHNERDTELEIKSLEKRLEQLEEQANASTSESIRRQAIGALEKERSRLNDLEDAGLEMLEKIEAARAGLDTAEQAVKTLQSGAEAAAQTARVARDSTVAFAAEIEPRRAAIAGEVQPELLQTYEGARVKYADSAICAPAGEYCGGCSGELTMHLIERARQRTEVMRCPHCNRILDVRVSVA